MTDRRVISALAGVLVLALGVPAALATPVAKTKDEYDLYGRVFVEPAASTNYI